jgi:predicted SAM-dependent methyltransferase
VFTGALKRFLHSCGLDVRRHPPKVNHQYSGDVTGGHRKVHHGCGTVLLPGWLNVDLHVAPREGFATLRVNLLERHPFADGAFDFAFSEDFLEHLPQSDQMIFLAEVHRTLRAGGVARISCPGLEGVLETHYAGGGHAVAMQARKDAYELHGHHHFVCQDELRLIARQLGFREVRFEKYRSSQVPELRDLEVRETQQKVNLYAELVR